LAKNAEKEDDNITILKKTIAFLFDYSISFAINQDKITICLNLIASVILLQLKNE
jgi:hypothetical protein